MIRVLFISSGLAVGGAEIVLLNLLQHLNRNRFEAHVVSLKGEGEIGTRIRALGIPVLALDLSKRPIADLVQLVRHIHHIKPDAIQTWMYHGDLFGSLAARLAGVRAIAWGLHNSSLSAQTSKRSTRLVRWLAARLSHQWPKLIVSCAHVARDIHVEVGYCATRFRVIANGFDVEQFQPDPQARVTLRNELGLAPETPIVLTVGRDNPQKNHGGFVRAAALVHAALPEVHFVMVGKGLNPGNEALLALVKQCELESVTHLLDLRQDTAQLMAGSDILVLASTYGEAFPLVLGEAMACGLRCVTTDVGDSRLLVADTGRVVAPGDDAAMAIALTELLHQGPQERADLSEKARTRIVQEFEIKKICREYEAVFSELAGKTCA
jgi:glycosyltransferase involved in cell wall biosynthesis